MDTVETCEHGTLIGFRCGCCGRDVNPATTRIFDWPADDSGDPILD